MHAPQSIYAEPPAGLPLSLMESFYHVMDLPGLGTTTGCWDLRGNTAPYLGFEMFDGKRALEIGPASGFLTAEMENLGAEVVAIEVTDDHGWDFVPFPADVLTPEIITERRANMRNLKAAFWLAHKACELKARVHYGDIYNMPDALGHFDIAVLAAVLLHVKSPHAVIEECAKRADTIVVTEMDYGLKGPTMRLSPSAENRDWGTWWHFAPEFFQQFLGVLGFKRQMLHFHTQRLVHPSEKDVSFFTVVASR